MASHGNRALNEPLILVVHDGLQSLELVAIHEPVPTTERGALIELEPGRVSAAATRRALFALPMTRRAVQKPHLCPQM
jgi:hypothetical protein